MESHKFFDYSTAIDKLTKQLHECMDREKELDVQIEEILQENSDMPKKLDLTLSRAKTRIAVTESDATQLRNLLELTSVLAENVSGKVRELDLCKSRVVDCLQRVEDVLDLRLCTEGIRSAMASEDYEQAASHVHRFLSLDNNVFKLDCMIESPKDVGSTAVTDASVHRDSLEHQYATMKNAEKDLKEIISAKFDEALFAKDVASMERFFKLFPLLNQHDVGLKKFGAHLKSQIADAACQNFRAFFLPGSENTVDQSRSSVLYADCLTILLESVARTFEIHQPLVESYYGPEHLLTLAEILQEQCDQESLHILDEFDKARQYNIKARLIDDYGRQSTKFLSKDKMDSIDIDHMLSEVALLQSRTQLYFRFMKRRIVTTLKKLDGKHEATDQSRWEKIKNEKLLSLDKFICDSRLNCRMQELIGRYIPMEEYYMRETVQKAIKIDLDENKVNSPWEASRMTSSVDANVKQGLRSALVDDVFFVVRKSIQRALSSSNVDCTCAVLNNACALLEMDFYRLTQQKIKVGYPATGTLAEAYSTAAAAYASVIQQGKVQPTTDGAEKARDEFLQSISNADSTAECIRALKELLEQEFDRQLSQSLFDDKGNQKAKLNSCLSQLFDVAEKFSQLACLGVEQLVTAAALPRIKMAAERLTDYTHCLDEAQFNDYEAGDPFIEQFVYSIDSLLNMYHACLTTANFAHFYDHVASRSAEHLEKFALKCSFNRLGALLFDKRIRDICAYYASSLFCDAQMSIGYGIREKFHRLTQFSSLLNVDNVSEAKDFYQCGGQNVSWRLSPGDVRKILSLRIDLPIDEVQKMKF